MQRLSVKNHRPHPTVPISYRIPECRCCNRDEITLRIGKYEDYLEAKGISLEEIEEYYIKEGKKI